MSHVFVHNPKTVNQPSLKAKKHCPNVTAIPGIVTLTNLGKASMVHVRACNMSAKIVALPSKSNICEIKEMKLLRSLPLNNTEGLTSDINQSK